MEMITESQNIISRDDLYNACIKVDWSDMIDTQSTLRVDTVLGSIPRRSDLSHSHFSSLTVKNSIVDQFRESTGGHRPSIGKSPDLPLL